MSAYNAFLRSKLTRAVATGLAEPGDVDERLFPFQRDCVAWALRRGRCALFEDTGLGKSVQQLAWAQRVAEETLRPTLILTPLAVAPQTVREAAKIGIEDIVFAQDGAEVARASIVVTNYDRLHRFDASKFGAVVLDESSCLKDFTSATRGQLIETFRDTPFKLCCTATPSPNDFTELGNHAEFLGIMSRAEMLSMWFVHDGGSVQDWRLKGHAEQDFWRWVSSWGLMVKSPSDLGYEDGGFALPPLVMHEHVVPSSVDQARAQGLLFADTARTLNERRGARRASLGPRVQLAADIVAAEREEQWLLWCDLNAEANALTEAIPFAEQVSGSDDREDKARRLLGFVDRCPRNLVTKPKIGAWGLNYQHCARVIFVGVSDSYEQWYQAIRRCWRFGQQREVHVHLVISESEGAVLENLKRKQCDAERMGEEMRRYTRALVREAVGATHRDGTSYEPTVPMRVPGWLAE